MVLLYKEYHAPWILDKSPHTGKPKTQTRRLWEKCRVRIGSVHQARTRLFDKTSTFCLQRILNTWPETLREMSEEDAVAEGYPDKKSFLVALFEINRIKTPDLDREIWAVEYEVVKKKCKYCGRKGPSKTLVKGVGFFCNEGCYDRYIEQENIRKGRASR